MPFCPLVHNNLEIKTKGAFTPCCISQKRFTIDGKEAHALKNTIQEVWNSDDRKQWVADFDQHFETDCARCFQIEKAGGESKRQMEIKRWDGIFEYDTLQGLDLKLGNTCNLACAICASHSSSKWNSIDKQFNMKTEPVQVWPRQKDFWDHLSTSVKDIRRIELSGGEPFMIKEQKKLINTLIETDTAKNVDITWFTNCTQWPEEFIQHFDKFETVRIMLSIDNTHEQFEFQRWPAKWDDTYKIFEKFMELHYSGKAIVGISHSISALNVYHLPKFHEWCREHKVDVFNNIVMFPLNMRDLPTEFKHEVAAQFTSNDPSYQINPVTKDDNWIVDFMMEEGNTDELFKQLEYKTMTRPGYFEKGFPEICKYWKQ